jgi:transketolase
MRYKFAEIFEQLAKKDKKTVFMTGDLGFHAFEKMRDSLGERFINAGVAEHNMVTAAAGLASSGLKPWIYSAAPFVTIKVVEEIQNDICLPNHDVKIIGLGGGYDYGIAGPTHHAINDIGIMLTLPNIKVYAPGFVEHLKTIIERLHKEAGPAYLRLTKAEKLDTAIPAYASLCRVLKGNKLVVIALGSIINRVIPAILSLKKEESIDLWLISEIPFTLPSELVASLERTKSVLVVEEHVKTGGLGHYLQHLLWEQNIKLKKFKHLHAKGYISHRYGSRDFHLKENRLDPENLKKELAAIL